MSIVENLDIKIKKFWPKEGPPTAEVEKYIKKYAKEKIVIKCGGRVLLDPDLFNNFINTKNTHGTGCTLSSAITTFLSCGKPIKKACELGIKYVNSAIKTNPKYGKGHGPINHLNSMKLDKKFR